MITFLTQKRVFKIFNLDIWLVRLLEKCWLQILDLAVKSVFLMNNLIHVEATTCFWIEEPRKKWCYSEEKIFLTKNNFFLCWKKLLFRADRRAFSKIQIFEIFKIMKMLKNAFNKITTWKCDQEEFYIMMFGISEWIHIIYNTLFAFRISSLVIWFCAGRRTDRRGLWSNFNVIYMLYLLIYS